MFMPVRAYIPPGTLRAAVAYPHSSRGLSRLPVIVKALADVGLEHLEPLLDKEDRWDRELTDDEKQRVAFARVILQRPRWVVVNDALDVLDPDIAHAHQALFTGALADVGIINIGHDQPDSGFLPPQAASRHGSARAELQVRNASTELLTDPIRHRNPLPPIGADGACLSSLPIGRVPEALCPVAAAKPNQKSISSRFQFVVEMTSAADVAWAAVRLGVLRSRISDEDSLGRRTRQGKFDRRLGSPAPSPQIDDAEGGRQFDAA